MIEGNHKGGKQLLPGIQEEIHRSTDSISTLESDTLTLESIEANLFEDIRASIQKSSTATNMADAKTKAGFGVGVEIGNFFNEELKNFKYPSQNFTFLHPCNFSDASSYSLQHHYSIHQ